MTENEYLELVELIAASKRFDVKKHTEKSLQRVTKAYAEEYKRLFQLITSESYAKLNPTTKATRADIASILSQLETELKRLDETTLRLVQAEVQQTYAASALCYVKVVEEISDSEKLLEACPFAMLNHYRIEQLVSETAEDLLFATNHVRKELKKTIQAIFAKNLQLHALQGTDYKSVIKTIEKELNSSGIKDQLLKRGFIGIIDAKGRKWNLSTYTKLIVTSKLQDAYHEAMKTEGMERGRDLAQISTNGATDSCAQFEGMIISMNGLTEGYLTYDALKATGLIFHPNCRHTCYPLRSFDLLHEDEQRIHHEQSRRVLNNLRKKL